jgi:hypothetical protein
LRTLVLLLGLLVAPLAAAGPLTDGCHAALVCVSEHDDGSCAEGFATSGSSVSVGGEVTLAGYANCYGASGESGFGASSAVGGAGYGELHYSDPENGDFQGCYVYALGTLYQSVDCLPTPAWGHLLP